MAIFDRLLFLNCIIIHIKYCKYTSVLLRNKFPFQLTVVSAFLDASLVYGSSDDVAASLRAGVGGRLNVDIRTNREWLPAATNKSAACDLDHEAQVCYMSGL